MSEQKTDSTCDVESCPKPKRKRLWCDAHYQNWRRTGTPTPPYRYLPDYPPEAECSIEGCTVRPYAHTWCSRHYGTWRRSGDPRKNVRQGSLLERWERKVDKGAPDECWIWKSGVNNRGYGFIWSLELRSNMYAHLAALILFDSPPPFEGAEVLHSCDNPPCVNPSHLRWGTHAENMAEMATRGRSKRKAS